LELGILYGIAAAAAFGSGDFTGGFATRRVSGITVAAGAYVVGFVLLLIPLVITRPPLPSAGALGIAAAAGALGGIGLVALYRGLAMGSMGIVTALSGIGSVGVPLLVGYAMGRAPVAIGQWVGVLLAMAAIGAASGATRRGVRAEAVVLGAAAAIFFGLWFLLLDVAAGEGEAWTLVASRGAGLLLIGGLALVRRRFGGLRAASPVVAATGLLDAGGNAGFVFARATLPVGVAAALAGLYPIVTMLLARLVLRERLPPLGLAAVVLAVAGVVLISLG
jgi:drug/metabolite transporter (DMT)-like permease